MRIYLDNCCYNRPYDDQSQFRIYLETQAKLYIQELIKQDKIELVTSYILEYENSKNKLNERRFSTMFETLEYNAQKEREQYKAEGRLEGKKESKVEIAKNMLINNLSITIISDCTGLSKEEIEKLK